MTTNESQNPGPDFSMGVAFSALADGVPFRGHVGGKEAIMVRRGEAVHILGAHCSHYHAPLADGLVVGDEIRCPWHHACFRLSDGAATRAPAFDSLRVWRAERVGELVFARERIVAAAASATPVAGQPAKIAIVGGGAAGFAAAFTLREQGYGGEIVLITADRDAPYDRPNLSKDYLAGSAAPDWLPLRPSDWYGAKDVRLVTGRRVERLDTAQKRLTLDDGVGIDFDRLLLATGAEPVRPPVPGADLPHVHYLRTRADSDALIAACAGARRVVVIGASFIGLEVAAALRARALETHVVAPEAIPMARILGPDLGAHIRALHEAHGVIFHLEDAASEIDATGLTLRSGGRIDADFVVMGVGVRPALSLAEQAGLTIDRGIVVDAFLETSAPDIFAAGDIARWPDKLTGERVRVEHWVVAARQGQTAARNMLGARERFEAAPFFWSQHYDQTIGYIGHAPAWDRAEISGDPASGDCAVTYYQGSKKLAVATLGRDLENLRAEVGFEAAMSAVAP